MEFPIYLYFKANFQCCDEVNTDSDLSERNGILILRKSRVISSSVPLSQLGDLGQIILYFLVVMD